MSLGVICDPLVFSGSAAGGVDQIMTSPQEAVEENNDLDFDQTAAPVLSLAARMASLDLDDAGVRTEREAQRGDAKQELAVSFAQKGENVFLTGKAGTGKSWATKQILKSLQQGGKVVHVTAPTGMAAINIDGTTIHSWGGFGLGSRYSDYNKMMSPESRKRVQLTDVLILDEISMLSGHMFDVLECMVTIVRNYEAVKYRLPEVQGGSQSQNGGKQEHGGSDIVNPHVLKKRWESCETGGLGDLPPWGGIQLIVVGDFYQLPPIPERGRPTKLTTLDKEMAGNVLLKVGVQGTYAFQSRSWPNCNFCVVELTKVHRQAADDGLLDLLNDVREGKEDLYTLHGRVISAIRAPLPDRDDGIVPTELYSTIRQVVDKNQCELEKMPGDRHAFASIDEIVLDDEYKKKLLKKYKLEEVAHIPYLWAHVDKVMRPRRWEEAKREVHVLEAQKSLLLAEEIYETVAPIRDKLKALQREITDIETDQEKQKIISQSSIIEWLKKNQKFDGYCGHMALEIYNKITAFQAQLVKDFKRYKGYANKRFFREECRVGEEIILKKNAQVMLLWNVCVESKLVNGSRGILVGFLPAGEYQHILVKEINERLKRGTSAKEKTEKGTGGCEGSKAISPPAAATFGRVEPHSSLKAEHMQSIINEVCSMSDAALQHELEIAEKSMSCLEMFPFIKFAAAKCLLVVPRPFSKEFRGFFRATRRQLPLAPAWAISIHKSQGMTIDYLKADLDGCFSPGQAYVACSRGRSASTMQIENFRKELIQVSKDVKRFYSALKRGKHDATCWADTLEGYNNTAHRHQKLEEVMERKHGKRCGACNAPCSVKIVTKETSKHKGKWLVRCTNGYGGGHAFDFVPEVPT
jgi:hypothetical protein